MRRFFVLCLALIGCATGRPPVLAAPVAPVAPSAPSSETAVVSEPAPAPPRSEESAAVPVSGRDPQWGNQDAPVTLVEIGDFQCPFCSRVEPTLTQLREKYGPAQLRIVWKNNPLPFHKNGRPAAEAGRTVFELGGNEAFWRFHDNAFVNQQSLSDDSYASWAAEAGIAAADFNAAYESHKYAAKIDEDAAMAKAVGAVGTPAFRINGVTLSGAQPIERFIDIIDAQLLAAHALIADGTEWADVYATLTKRNLVIPVPQPPSHDTDEDDKSVWKVPVLADDPTRGPKDALVTLIEFADFQCPFSKRVQDTLEQVAAAYPHDVRFVWKDNPLPFHPRARPAATLARLVYKTKGERAFWSMDAALFEANPRLEDDDLKSLAVKAGLKWADVKAAIDSDKFGDKLDAGVELANDTRARGTPSFFINGVRLSGAQPFEAFKQAISEQLLKARALVARGVPKAKLYAELIKDAKEAPEPERKELPPADASCPVKGSPNAPISITIFADFECPFCKRVQPTLVTLEHEYGSSLELVWRNMPLALHTDAPLAAQAAMEAFAQKGNPGFWQMHDLLFEAQGTSPDAIKRPALEQMAATLGLDMAKFKVALDGGTHQAKLDADSNVGTNAGIMGTPGFVINGYYLSGAQPVAAFKKVIRLALHGRVVPTLPALPSPTGPSPAASTSPAAPASPTVLPPDSIEASHILVQYAGAQRAALSITRTKAEARTRAGEALAKAVHGASFADLARHYSDDPGSGPRGGGLGVFKREQMIKPFADAAFALKTDEISTVVETPFGFHIIKRTR